MRVLIAPVLVLVLCAAPLAAQDTPAPAPDAPPSLAEQAEGLLRKFLDNVAPEMQQMQEGLQAMEPEMQDLLSRMRDMVQYHPPEVLPNGDILIRRRTPDDGAAPADPAQPPEGDAPVTAPFEL